MTSLSTKCPTMLAIGLLTTAQCILKFSIDFLFFITLLLTAFLGRPSFHLPIPEKTYIKTQVFAVFIIRPLTCSPSFIRLP